MICAISGEAPQAPVTSRKSGNVYERRLIEQYIRENGTDPVNGEELSTDDLLDLKQPRAVKPRAPAQTSIPALLSSFQNEWDALVLETFTLKKQLATTRQELSTALYYNDAAEKVIARLARERDEAREALSKVTVSHSNGGPDAMQVDGQQLPDDVLERIEQTREQLSKTRRKRAIPENWAVPELIHQFDQKTESAPLVSDPTFIALDSTKDLALVGGTSGRAAVYSQSQQKAVNEFECGAATVVGGAWYGQQPVVGLSTGAVKVFSGAEETASFSSHAGSVTAVCLHPCGDVLASVGIDKSFVLYDLATSKVIRQQYIDTEIICAAFHPDGHLLVLGTRAGKIEMMDVKTGENLATYDATALGSLRDLCFSENGTWLATTSDRQTGVSIWDLRKSAVVGSIEMGVEAFKLKWDYTGQYIAVRGVGCVAVHHYSKASKSWSQTWIRAFNNVAALEWGPEARSLVAASNEGCILQIGG